MRAGKQQQFQPPSNHRAAPGLLELKHTIIPSALDTTGYFSQKTPSFHSLFSTPQPLSFRSRSVPAAGLYAQLCWPGLVPLHRSRLVQPCTRYIKSPSLSLRGAAKPEDEVTVFYVNSEHIQNLESLMLNHVKFCCYRDIGWRKENASITCIFQL